MTHYFKYESVDFPSGGTEIRFLSLAVLPIV